MVTSLGTALGSDDLGDRAQLILVGAVAIAIIVMGLVVVFNTVLYVDNVAATGEVNAPGDAEAMSETINDSSRALIERVNAGPRWQNAESGSNDVTDGVLANLSVYSTALSNGTARSQAVVVSIEEGDPTERVFAARIEDTDGGEFTASGMSGSANWSVNESNEGLLVRDFDMIVETDSLATEGSDEEFHIVWNATNAPVNYTVWVYEESGGDDDVVIRTLASGPSQDPLDFAAGTPCTLEGSNENDTVTLNISDGSIQGYPGCSSVLDVTDGVSHSTLSTLGYFYGDEIEGRYSMVAWQEDSDPGSYLSSDIEGPSALPLVGTVPSDDSPYWSYAMWEMELDVSYDSGSITYSESFVIEVYNRSR